ncbi:prion-like-(Q/N-rich) domain-bearing protein 25 [Tribolium madens]|uniref:prion-like-(Q/N-rich) domain-bearing protein 25 n=1 Tax=Tribolium madens TaxID=41895 RepID=UPI001CF732EF|nr:prion-like-(Q/N-rich) domain-bearing protein 25 [Tribolium madens]
MNYFINYIMLILTFTEIANCCSTDDDCQVFNTTCNKGTCECPLGYILDSEEKECLPYVTEYNGECSENTQCEWLGENSECANVCRCKKGYRWYLGVCRKYVGLGEDCSENIDCFDGYNLQSLSCLSGKCACSEGYYQRDNTDCRKIASKKGDLCALDIDCKAENTACILGKCKERKSYLTLDENEEEIEEEIAKKATDVITCTTNDDCNNIPNSECYEKTGTCICKKQYFFNADATACIAELGVKAECTKDSDCPLKPGKCQDGVCYCRDYYFVADGNQKCVKTISQTNTNCLSKEWCYAWGSRVYCTSNETCSCSKTAKFGLDNALCIWNGSDEPECSADYQCNNPKNSFCVDETCQCRGAAVVVDDQCLPGLGDSCDEKFPCGVKHSSCINNVCQCLEEYIQQENACYSIIHNLGGECTLDVQCSTGITYSECVDGICNCQSDRIPYNNICYQKTEYGGYCNSDLECKLSLNKTFGDSIQCRNRKCQCPTGYTLSENKCSSSDIVAGNFLVVTILMLKSVLSVFS